MVKISRLYQPRNPLFWLMVVLNLLSTALVWLTQAAPLATFGLIVVAVFALGNAVLGTYLMWRLVKS
jgi:hypothetical protein